MLAMHRVSQPLMLCCKCAVTSSGQGCSCPGLGMPHTEGHCRETSAVCRAESRVGAFKAMVKTLVSNVRISG